MDSLWKEGLGFSSCTAPERLGASAASSPPIVGAIPASRADPSRLSELTRHILDGTGPFAPSQCHRLLEGATASLTIEGRLESLERSHGDSARAHAKLDLLLQAAHTKLDQLHSQAGQTPPALDGRLEGLEKALAKCDQAFQDVSQSHQSAGGQLDRLQGVHDRSEDRLAYLERVIGALADKNDEVRRGMQSADKVSTDQLTNLRASQSGLQERVDYLEKVLGDSAEKHAKELANAHERLDELHGHISQQREAHANHRSELESRLTREQEARGQVQELLAGQQESGSVLHASLKERVDFLERLLGESAEKQATEIEAVRSSHEKHLGAFSRHAGDFEALRSEQQSHARDVANEVAKLKVDQASHASMSERLGYVETLLGDSADKHTEALAAAHARLDELQSRHASVHELLAGEKAARDKGQASLAERVEYIETLVGDSADRYAGTSRDLSAAHDKIDKLHGRLAQEQKARESHHATVGERLTYVEKVLGDSADKHSLEWEAAHAKLDQLHGRLTSCEGHGASIEGLKQGHAEHKKTLQHHASMEERLAYLERTLGASADKQERDLVGLHAKVEQMHGRLSDESATRDAHHASLHALIARDKESRDSNHASFQERVAYLERQMGDSFEKHDQVLQQLHADMHGQHSASHSRIGQVEQRLAEQKEHFVNRLDVVKQDVHSRIDGVHSTAQSKIDDVNSKHDGNHEASERSRDAMERAIQHHLAVQQEVIEQEAQARERLQGHVQELFAREREAREKTHAVQTENLEIETTAREQALREILAAMAKDRAAHEEHRETVKVFFQNPTVEGLPDTIAQERQERLMHLEQMRAYNARAEETQRSAGLLRRELLQLLQQRLEEVQAAAEGQSSLLRRELDRLSAEAAKLWQAMDGQARDLAALGIETYPTVAVAARSLATPPLTPTPGAGAQRRASAGGRVGATPPLVPSGPPGTPGNPAAAAAAAAQAAALAVETVIPVRAAVEDVIPVRSASPVVGGRRGSTQVPVPVSPLLSPAGSGQRGSLVSEPLSAWSQQGSSRRSPVEYGR